MIFIAKYYIDQVHYGISQAHNVVVYCTILIAHYELGLIGSHTQGAPKCMMNEA